MDSEPWYSLMFRPKAGKSTVIPPKDALDGIDPLILLSHILQLRCQYPGLIGPQIVMMVVAGNVIGGITEHNSMGPFAKLLAEGPHI